MAATILSRDWLLWSLSVVYLFGFASLFVQAPGLFGEHGITPAIHLLGKEAESVEEFLTNKPTLLRILPKIGLDTDIGIDFLCVAGVIVSFVASISKDHRNALVAALQWIFYLSIVQVGHIFLSSKWDSLLLETGFVAILLAPFGYFGLHDWKVSSLTPVDESENHRLSQWLMRWILFRVILGEGLTSLINIFGLNYHYGTTEANLQNLLHLHEHQILPTPLSWLMSLLPSALIAFCTGLFITTHIICSILVLLPSKRLREFLFYWQCFSVLCGIILSNQGFYPLLLASTSLSLINDDFFKNFQFPWKHAKVNCTKCSSSHQMNHKNGFSSFKEQVKKNNSTKLKRFLVAFLIILSVFVFYGYPVLHSNGTNDENIFVELIVSALHSVYGSVGFILLLAILLGGTSLILECAHVFKKLWHKKNITSAKKAFNLVRFSCLTFATAFLFFISLVPLTWVNSQDSGNFLPNGLQEAYLWTHKNYKLVNNYITISKKVEINGTHIGRLELILEGSKSLESEEWIEYSFRFKPGHTSTSPYIITPHHPRLDESLWFAAQSNYKQHHWILNLVHRLFNNQEEVLDLLGDNPFKEEPPQYIKASLYEYHFAYNNHAGDSSSSDWFTRKWIGHYLPVLSKADPSFAKYLKLSGIIRISDNKRNSPLQLCKETNFLGTFLRFLRSLLGQNPSYPSKTSCFQTNNNFDGKLRSSCGQKEMQHYFTTKNSFG